MGHPAACPGKGSSGDVSQVLIPDQRGQSEFVAIDEQPNDESVRRMNRLILVRKLMGLLSIVCVFSLPT